MSLRGQRSRWNPKNFEVKYLENGTREKKSVNGSKIESHVWAFEWYEIFWPHMTFKGQRSRSNLKKFEVKYLKNGTREKECKWKLAMKSCMGFRMVWKFLTSDDL